MDSAWLLWGELAVLWKALKMVHFSSYKPPLALSTPRWTANRLPTFSPFHLKSLKEIYFKMSFFLFVLVISYGAKCLRDACLVFKIAAGPKKASAGHLCFLSWGPFPSFPCANILLSTFRRLVSIPWRSLEPCRCMLLPTLSLFIMGNKNLKYLYPITWYIFKQK